MRSSIHTAIKYNAPHPPLCLPHFVDCHPLAGQFLMMMIIVPNSHPVRSVGTGGEE